MSDTQTMIDRDKLHERVLEEINAKLKGTLHVVEGAPQASVKLADGTYRTKPVFGDQELFFKEVYIGKSGKILFVFTPADDMPWVQCEWDAVKLDQAIPLFGGVLADKFGYDGENAPEIVHRFVEDVRAQMIDEIELEKITAAETHAANPKFGMF